MSWKEIVSDYFRFTRKDRIAVLVLAVLIIFVLLAPRVLVAKKSSLSNVETDTAWILAIKKLEKNDEKESVGGYAEDNSVQFDRRPGNYSHKSTGELFYFDPNTLDAPGWKKLGLRDKTIRTIQNYLSKGGHFYKAEELSKIYGLFDDEYKRLEPYVRIEKMDKNGPIPGQNKIHNIPVSKAERYKTIEINTADSTAFIALPGIGAKLANRIINFREKLGGFYSITQIGETFGLPDSTFQKIKQYLRLEIHRIKKININTGSVDELKAHPYIRYSIANSIIAYRNEHGIFSKIEDIKKVMAVTDEVYDKVFPYLTTDN